ncbi:MAG: hypothetical protein BGO49_00560 [Planctomycetales bacterium 71-10]|nr:MAG: hypothetical protein BGO49_00560 [Planctomycetales bacterium 71-10]
MNDGTIYVGDCIEVLRRDQLSEEPLRPRLIVADPPYNIGHAGYDVYEDDLPAEDYVAWSGRWLGACVDSLARDGSLWVAIGDEYQHRLRCLLEGDLGMHFRSHVVWHYTFGQHSEGKFTRSHAHLLYYVRDPEAFAWNPDAIRVPSARQRIYKDRRAVAAGRIPDDTWVLRPQEAPPGAFAPDSDTWHVPRVNGTFKERCAWHPCQLPEAMLARIVRACSDPGDLVCDPFAGTCSTLVVAKKLGRRWAGVELSEDYTRKGLERVEAAAVGDPIARDLEPAGAVDAAG